MLRVRGADSLRVLDVLERAHPTGGHQSRPQANPQEQRALDPTHAKKPETRSLAASRSVRTSPPPTIRRTASHDLHEACARLARGTAQETRGVRMGLRPPWSANICAPPHANCAPIGVWPTCVLRKWMGVCAKVSRRRFSGSPCGRAGSAREEGIARPEAC